MTRRGSREGLAERRRRNAAREQRQFLDETMQCLNNVNFYPTGGSRVRGRGTRDGVAWLATGLIEAYDPARFVRRRLTPQELEDLCRGQRSPNRATAGRCIEGCGDNCPLLPVRHGVPKTRNRRSMITVDRREMKDCAAQAWSRTFSLCSSQTQARLAVRRRGRDGVHRDRARFD